MVDGATCAIHQAAAAAMVCNRCGRFTCVGCTSSDGLQCAECFVWSERQISKRAYATVALGLIGLFGVLPATAAVPWLARRERRAIADGRSPRGGADVITSAQWMAWITVVAWGVPAVIYSLWWLLAPA
ncbi:MAG: hypothetical protein QM723_30275 [Myxococcaceae bacterium]